MIRLIALAAFALALATSAQAMSPLPLHQSGGMFTEVQYRQQVRQACGPGRVRIQGICVLRTPKSQTHPLYRRCVAWNEGMCVQYR
jgi:hypothetical protein